MKRLNPITNQPFKCGDTREDGFMFNKYKYDRLKKTGFFGEQWLNPKAYENNSQAKNNYKNKHPVTNANERAKKLNRMPNWLSLEDKKQIKRFYDLAKKATLETGVLHHVDHIVPLQGNFVSGLHTPWNLQILTAEDNLKKSNLFSS